MKVLFYASFNRIGERVILTHRADFDFSALPPGLQQTFSAIDAQACTLDQGLEYWWECPAARNNLDEKGYDFFTFVRG